MHPITAAIHHWLEKENDKAVACVWQSLSAGASNNTDIVCVHRELVELGVMPAVVKALENSV